MRIWKGTEREGKDIGLLTLFIESTSITEQQMRVVKSIAQKEGIKRLYFGAGKVDTLNICGLDQLDGYECIIEVSAGNFLNINNREKFNEVIVRVDCLQTDKNVRLKADNGKDVQLYYRGIKSSTQDVLDGLYANDTILYE